MATVLRSGIAIAPIAAIDPFLFKIAIRKVIGALFSMIISSTVSDFSLFRGGTDQCPTISKRLQTAAENFFHCEVALASGPHPWSASLAHVLFQM